MWPHFLANRVALLERDYYIVHVVKRYQQAVIQHVQCYLMLFIYLGVIRNPTNMSTDMYNIRYIFWNQIYKTTVT